MTMTTNGTKRAVLYARVSTKRQVDGGYSLDQQIDALRELAAKEGYEVLEEVKDPGYTGKTLDRPGLSRVRELVSEGGVATVLIQDRDRLSREPAYTFLLRQEFEKFGTVIRDPSGRGQETPMDELATNILDSVAKFERQLTALRMKRGKVQAVKKGRVLATRSPAYGFKLTPDRRGYVVNEETMPTVRRIVGMVADGVSLGEVVRTLTQEGTPSPQGGNWAKPVIRHILKNPAYEPHPAEEVAGMVETEVAAGLERGRSYGLWSYDGIPVPIPESGIERETVLRARANIAGNRAPSNAGRRLWTLSGGIARCPECGGVLEPHSAPRPTKTYFYYRCRRRHGVGTWACTYTRGLRAEAFEDSVWEKVSGLVDHEQLIRDAYDEHIDRARCSASKQNMDRLARTVEDAETERRGFLRLAAQGRMTDAELDEALSETDERKRAAQETLEVARKNEDWATGLEAMRDLMLWAVRRDMASHEHTPPQRASLYRKMRLRVTPDAEDEGMRLEFAYDDGEGFCEPNNPSWNTSSGTSWQ